MLTFILKIFELFLAHSIWHKCTIEQCCWNRKFPFLQWAKCLCLYTNVLVETGNIILHIGEVSLYHQPPTKPVFNWPLLLQTNIFLIRRLSKFIGRMTVCDTSSRELFSLPWWKWSLQNKMFFPVKFFSPDGPSKMQSSGVRWMTRRCLGGAFA